MAFRLARRTGRSDITAMPLGLDTPSTFGTVFLIIGPAFQEATGRGLDTESAARHAWFLGITMLLASGVFKLACAPFSGWIRKIVPRAGLLGSLAAIALVLISFLPLLDIAVHPVAGMVALGLILATLTVRWQFPLRDSGSARGGGDRLFDLLRAYTYWGGGRVRGVRGAFRNRCSGRRCRFRSRIGWAGSANRGRT